VRDQLNRLRSIGRCAVFSATLVAALNGCTPAKAPSTTNLQAGRYVIVHSPQVERDTQLVDTATGDTWVLTSVTSLNDEPFVWEPVPRMNTDADWKALAAKHGVKAATDTEQGAGPWTVWAKRSSANDVPRQGSDSGSKKPNDGRWAVTSPNDKQ